MVVGNGRIGFVDLDGFPVDAGQLLFPLKPYAQGGVMTKVRRAILWPVWLIALVVLSVWTFAATSGFRSRSETTKSTPPQTTPNVSAIKRSAYIRRSLLSPKLVWHLKALGDRLEKPGRERLSITGTLSRAKDGQAEEVNAVWEFPQRLRLITRKGNDNRILTFDGEQVKSGSNVRGNLCEVRKFIARVFVCQRNFPPRN